MKGQIMTINNVTLCGNLVRDPEKKGTEDNPVLTFSIAVNEFKANAEDYASYFDCVVFGKRAGSLSRVLHKGLKVCVEGRLHQSRFETKEGEKRSKVEVYVNDLEFMSSKNTDKNDEIPW